jgi:hypothetical protein
MKIRKPKETVEVPNQDEMDDDTFISHLELRHAAECKFENKKVRRMAVSAWIGPYRAFHDRLHRLATPGQYDHTHEED